MVTTTAIPDWLAQLYPFTPRRHVTASGASLSYLDEGPRSDEAVLMLHGNPTWSFYYRDLVRALAPALRCIVPDHIGMGLSAKPQDYDYVLATRIADIEGLVGALGLKRVHLVVHDWGGAIGFGWAVRCPTVVGRITILNTAAFAAEWIPWRIAACKIEGLGPLIVRGLNGFAGPATWMSMHRRSLTPDEKRGYLYPYGSWSDRVAVSAFVRDIPLGPDHPSWATLVATERGLTQFRDRPVLIFWGGRDFCFNRHFFEQWTEFLPQAERRYEADAGHYVLDDARDTVVPAVVQFLTRA